jgi:hypothetical protein
VQAPALILAFKNKEGHKAHQKKHAREEIAKLHPKNHVRAKIKRMEAPKERIIIKALHLGQEGEVRSEDKAPFLTRNTHHPTLSFPSSATSAGSSSISHQSASPHSDHHRVSQSSHTPDHHLLYPTLLQHTQRVTFNLRSIEATPLMTSKHLSCRSLPLNNVPDSLLPRLRAGIANSTCSTKSNQTQTSSSRSSSKPLKAIRCGIPRTACGRQKHSLSQGSNMENKGTTIPGTTLTTGGSTSQSSGHTQLSPPRR